MLTESSRFNLGVAFSRSYGGHKWWILVAFVVCYILLYIFFLLQDPFDNSTHVLKGHPV